VALYFAPRIVGSGTALAAAGEAAVAVAFLYLAAISIALASIDLETRRLPNRIVLPAYAVGFALLGTGATVGVLSGGPPLRRALRQLAIGAGAAAVTYGLGVLFGATLGSRP
jgi:VIT1/CCC1 family predicted Fe2+/Mn2+ transporter